MNFSRAVWGKRGTGTCLASLAQARPVCLLLAVAVALAGCTTKAKAKSQARAAYLAGQQRALANWQQSRGPSVTVVGRVRNPIIAWTEDLTVAKAIVAADYYGRSDPTDIVVVRNGEQIAVDPKHLLRGEDFPLQAGDVLELKQ